MSTLRLTTLKNEASTTDTITLNADGSCRMQGGTTLNGVVTISGAVNFGTASLPSATDMGGVLSSGSLTNSNPTIVFNTSTANLSGGMLVTGEGIPAGTTLTTIFTNASGTLSNNATATTTFKPVTFYRNDKLLTPASVGGQLCRAWVNFNGTGTISIRAAYNVSSVTDDGSSVFVVNFSQAMPDANYSFALSKSEAPSEPNSYNATISATTVSSTSLKVRVRYSNGVLGDDDYMCASIFR